MCQLKSSVFLCWKLTCDLACFINRFAGHFAEVTVFILQCWRTFVWPQMEEEKIEILSKMECSLITLAVYVCKSKKGFMWKLCRPIFWTRILKFTARRIFLWNYVRSATLGVLCWWAAWMKADCWPLHLLKSVSG